MVTVGLLVRLEAKPGKADEVAHFLEQALPQVEQEPATTAWFAIRLSPSTFGIFDAFPDNSGREAHLSGVGSRSPPHAQRTTTLTAASRRKSPAQCLADQTFRDDPEPSAGNETTARIGGS